MKKLYTAKDGTVLEYNSGTYEEWELEHIAEIEHQAEMAEAFEAVRESTPRAPYPVCCWKVGFWENDIQREMIVIGTEPELWMYSVSRFTSYTYTEATDEDMAMAEKMGIAVHVASDDCYMPEYEDIFPYELYGDGEGRLR